MLPRYSAYTSMKTDQLKRLQDIHEAARLIVSHLKNTTEAGFLSNVGKQYVIIRQIEIMATATARLKESTRQAVPALPVRRLKSMRKIVGHDYGSVNLKVVWKIGTMQAPQILAVLENFLSPQASAAAPARQKS